MVTLLTQMVVDADDPGFKSPTKPIGPFYSEQEAQALAAEKGYTMKEDAGRGWRRVVASPIPAEIVELDSIKELIGSAVVITCGGGGIPVLRREDGALEGVAAVIDKDFAAELLAESIDADMLLILTEVERVALNFNKPDQKELSSLTLAAIVSGAAFGAHVCFYTDVTVFTSTMTRIDNQEHAVTQLPYGLLGMLISAAAYAVAGYIAI